MPLNNDFRKPKKFKLSLRSGLLIVLLAAVVTFVGQAMVTTTAYYRYAAIQQVGDAENDYVQTKLEIRVRKLEEARLVEMGLIENKLDELPPEDGVETPVTIDDVSPFAVEQVMGSVVEIICLDNSDKDTFYTGSGIIIDGSGLVLTNRHLLMSEDGSMIRFCGVGFTTDIEQPPQIEFIAESTAMGDELDLAILQIVEHLDGDELPATYPVVTLSGSREATKALKLGDRVFIAGYPGIGADTFTLTQGVVSGRVGSNLIKTSALIDSGTSGGAAFDGNGRFIGMPTAAAAGDIGGSLGYLIAADVVDDFLRDFYAGDLNDSVPFVD